MEAKAHIKNVRISPIKLRFFLDAIKATTPARALDALSIDKRRTAKVLYKAIKSAADNGINTYNMSLDRMVFTTLKVDEGTSLKRFRAGSKGTGKPYVRKSSHITVVLTQTGAQPAVVKEMAAKTPKVEEAQVVQQEAKAGKTVKTAPKKLTAKKVTNKKA